MRSSGVPHDDCLRTRATILRTIAPGLHEAALPNGKPVTSHLSKELAVNPPELPEGTVVMLEISPFDLDRARIAEVIEIAEAAKEAGEFAPGAREPGCP